ncbi:MAG: sulfatase [Clostridia bacterium]
MNRPNILFAIADDASHFGIYGHKMVETPNIDSIAVDGIIFNNAFTTNPKCAPSRASILTGKHTWNLKSGCTHFCEFPANQKLYPQILEDLGYHVGFTGKGWGPGDYEINGYTHNPAGNEYNDKVLTPPTGSSIFNTDYVGNFKDFLSKKESDKPFCFWYGCREPHRAYTMGEGISHGKDINKVDVPTYLPDCETVKSDFCDYAFEIDWFDKQFGYMVDYLKEIGEYENTLIVVTSDNGCPFPRVKGQMYEEDIRLPLVITWQGHINKGRQVDDLVSFIDFAPTFIELAGGEKVDDFDGQSLTDILFSTKSGYVTDYRNRAFMGRERHDMGRINDIGYPVRCIRTPQYLYVHNYEPTLCPAGNPETYYPNCDNSPTKTEILLRHAVNDNIYYNLSFGLRPLEELFDIKKDPECLVNLALNPGFDELKESLWKELQIKLINTNDPRAKGEGDIFDTYKYVNNAPHAWYNLQKKYDTWLSDIKK